MIVDFHTHLFPKEIRDNRDRFFHEEPAFRLLYKPLSSKLVGTKDLLQAMDEARVDISVIFGFPWKNPETFMRHNDYIMEAVSRHPNRLVGLCCFDPLAGPSGKEVHRCLAGGLSGVGEIAFYDSGLSEQALVSLDSTMDVCKSRDVPVLIHVNEPIGHAYAGKTKITLAQIEALVRRFPENKIVLAHWGGGVFFYHLLKKEIKEVLKNVYFDTAASPFLYDPKIYRVAADIIGPEKILFGSDFPLIRTVKGLREMETAGLLPEEIIRIRGQNAAELLRLSV